MPLLSNYFVQRDTHFEQLKYSLTCQKSTSPGALDIRVVHGMGGIGKTTLAAAIAHNEEIRAYFPDGILWATLGEQPDLLTHLREWIRALDPSPLADNILLEDATKRLQAILIQGKRVLSIVDDVWEPEHAFAFLAGGPGCHLLFTTRLETISAAVEAPAYPLDTMTSTEARRFLQKRVGKKWRNGDESHAEKLAKLLGYLPLALELMGALVATGSSWQDLLEDLQPETEIIDFTDLDVANPNRQTEANARKVSLVACINVSLKRLDETALQCLILLGIFREDSLITNAAVATLCGMDKRKAGRILLELKKKSLLSQKERGEDRAAYQMHDIIRKMVIYLLTSPLAPSTPGRLPGLEISLPEAHLRLLLRYQAHLKNGQWHTLEDDGYIHEQLTWHMEKAGQVDWILSLLQEETVIGQVARNAWYEVRESAGQTAGYIEDVRRAWRLVWKRSRQEQARGESIANLGLEIRLVLILTSLNSLAANLPIALIESLVRDGVWKPIVGLTYIRQIPDRERRVEAFIAIAGHLTPEQLQEVLSTVREIEDPYSRFGTLSGIASSLAIAGKSVEALSVAREIENVSSRAGTLSSIAPHLSDTKERTQALSEILSTMREIEDSYYRAEALTGIAPYLKGEQLQEALSVARKIEDVSSRAEALRSIAPCLPNPEERIRIVSETLSVVREIEDVSARAEALRSIVPHLMDPEERTRVVSETLSAAREVENLYYRVEALMGIIPHVIESTERAQILVEALATTREIENASARARVLRGIASSLTDPPERSQILVEALSATREIENASARMGALGSILPLLTAAEERTQVLSEVLVAGREITDLASRAQALVGLASSMAMAGESGEALSAACVIEDPYSRAEALKRIAPLLTGEQLPEFLLAVREIEDSYSRAEILSGIAPHLTDATAHTQVLLEALSAARQIADSDSRAGALSSIALLLTAEQLPQALLAARAIEDTYSRAGVLNSIAPLFTETAERNQVLSEALAATHEITDPSSRARALMGFASALAMVGKLAEALSAAREIADAYSRAGVLSSIAALFTETAERNQVLAEALAATHEIADTYTRAGALMGLASSLAMAGNSAEALSVARAIEDPYSRAEALSGIASRLTAEQLLEALSAAREIADAYSRAGVLNSIAPLFIEAAERNQVLSEALAATHEITDPSSRARALMGFASALAMVGKLAEALSTAHEIADAYSRAEALSGIASHLTESPERTRVLSEALSAAHEIKDVYARAGALSGIAPHLTDSMERAQRLSEVLSTTREIEDTSLRTGVLRNIAPHMLHIPTEQFCSLWDTFMQMAVLQTRQDMQSLLAQLTPVLIERGDKQTMNEVIQALLDVARWW